MNRVTQQRLEVALGHVDRGWGLIPLAGRSKDPHFELLPTDADGKAIWSPLAVTPATREEVRGWFARDPKCNIGILTGQASGGLVVADFDRDRPSLPLTAMACTDRGIHAYFRHATPVKSRVLPWGELKGEGGYVVAPPSVHPSGHRYEWHELLSPQEAEFADLPTDAPWLAGAVSASGRKTSREFEDGADDGDGVTVARKIVSCYGGLEGGIEERRSALLALAAAPAVALAIARHCKFQVERIGQSFLCPLPGHREQTPSAALWQMPGWPVRLHCFHDDSWWFLPDLYAAITTGRVKPLSKGVRAMWWLRVLNEARVVTAPMPAVPMLPNDAPAPARKLYDGFCDALRLRMLYDPQQNAMPFTWSFAGHWCGIGSQTTVGNAQRWLLSRGYLRIEREGASGNLACRRSTLLSLGSPADDGRPVNRQATPERADRADESVASTCETQDAPSTCNKVRAQWGGSNG